MTKQNLNSIFDSRFVNASRLEHTVDPTKSQHFLSDHFPPEQTSSRNNNEFVESNRRKVRKLIVAVL